MNKNVIAVTIVALTFLLASCSKSKLSEFPLEKPYWDPKDYDFVIRQIDFNTNEGESYPRLNDPEMGIVMRRLIDKNNLDAVIQDQALGLKHRNQYADDMFQEYRDLHKLYSAMDREDKYIYDQELTEIQNWGYYVMIYYFKLGNDVIIQESDTPENPATRELTKGNEKTLINNFDNYLDLINHEHSFSPEVLTMYAQNLEANFDLLMKEFPAGNYKVSLAKAKNMQKKAQNADVKKVLISLIAKFEAITVEKTEPQQTL